jgi:dTDP-4-dehydrorhamnose reductase
VNNILVTGCNGQLGSEFKKLKNKYNDYFFLFKDINLDITEKDKLERFIKSNSINIVLNTAAYTNVAKAEIEKDKADKINNLGVRNLTEICEKYNLKLIHFSTDYVYSSNTKNLIDEEKITNPLNYYGISKRNGELYVEKSSCESIVIRTSWLYSSNGKNFVNTIIEKAKQKESINVVCDQFGCPTYAKDLAFDIMKILKSNLKLDYNGKIYNYSNLGFTNWAEFAKEIINISEINCTVNEVHSNFFKNSVKRPKFSITDKNKIISNFGLNIPHWKESLRNYLNK